MDKNFRTLMADAKFFEGYARFDENLGRYETWEEAVSRVMDMHRYYYANLMTDELKDYIDLAERLYKEKKVLGAQRALQFGGDQLLKNHSRLYNCAATYADRPEFFGECFHLMLCGCGVGFSVQRPHVASMPEIQKRNKDPKTFVVPDSIEGWARALDVLMSSFLKGGVHQEYEGHKIYFDLEEIRPKGAHISGGFKAPGPEPLRKALDRIEQLIKEILRAGRNVLKPIDIYDITMHAADAVISGGVRRAATICLFSLDDQEMMRAKTGNWFNENPQRARSNNSVVLLRDQTSYAELQSIVSSIKECGEPGFVFSDDIDTLFNPCCEIGLYPRLESGKTGVQMCVSGDTTLITREGKVKIQEAVGKNIAIWNGEKWSQVSPQITGTGRELYRVKFSDGSYLDCTDNHKFLAKDRFRKSYKEFTTLELLDELNNNPYPISAPRANIIYSEGKVEKYAYDYGFVLGDGTIREPTHSIYTSIFKGSNKETIKFKSNTKVVGDLKSNKLGTEFQTISFPDLSNKFAYELKYTEELPKEVFTWNKDSILSFIAGWADADGTQASKGIRIYGEENKIRDAHLLLLKVGICSSINLMSKKGTYVSSVKCNRTRDIWYLQITKTIEIPCQRLTCDNPSEAKYKGKNKVIKSIEKLEGFHTVYCFEEFELHQGVFNSVLTKQCNLTEINGRHSDSREQFFEQCQAAAILGTLQAGYTNFKFLNEESHKLIEEEALIGVGVTGWMNNPDILFEESNMKEGAEIVKATNKVVADILGINPAARCTTVKPSGNSSVLLETTSGIHGEHAPMYIRNVQFNKETEIAKIFEKLNPDMVSDSVWSQNGTDVCVSFPVISPVGSKYKSELLGVKQLEYVKKAQQYWIEYGTDVELCRKPYLRHNVSNTITVDDWDEVIDYVYDNRDFFCGVSFLSEFGDKALPQAPFTEVLNLQQLTDKYGAEVLLTSALIEAGLHAFNDDLWLACNTALGRGLDISKETHSNIPKRDFVRRFSKFSENFPNKEICAECLKDVYLFHKWWKIQKNCRFIDFVNELEEKRYTDINTMGAQACAGGACEIEF